MFQQSLPGVAQAVADARAWIRTIVTTNHPHVPADLAVQVTGDLVKNAVRHTPQDGRIEISVIPAQRGGLRLEVRDPDLPATGAYEAPGWAEVSRVVRDFGASSTADGHVAWVEIPESAGAQ
ncbi:ATP-binding protein [Nonomuraea sediminis]|uniref:ATP-binding protein n=1 Tax=Nonomuraea sediminis TaxID=2835864 RepID=UPI001BDD449E|nr:ATP-binding protein [Nonomuraea sediminis]